MPPLWVSSYFLFIIITPYLVEFSITFRVKTIFLSSTVSQTGMLAETLWVSHLGWFSFCQHSEYYYSFLVS